jgi:hypothetical protein
VWTLLACFCSGLSAAIAASGDTLVDVVRAATEPYQNPAAAIAAGWLPAPACVSGPEKGAMGIHFVNVALFDGVLDAERPEALIYEQKNGQMRLVGVEFIELVDAWHATHLEAPVLRGQQFHYVGSPNRYAFPAFYELHVWAWRDNPSGTFADWNPNVSCDAFTGE